MCDVCNGHSGCPVCSKEPVYVDCSECNGDGYFYYTEDGEDVSDVCEVCDGEGQIIHENEQ